MQSSFENVGDHIKFNRNNKRNLLRFIFFSLTANVLALGEEADFEAQNCLPALNLIRSTKLQLSTEPAFLPNACVCPAYAGHTPKAFQIVQKYKFSFMNQVFGVLFFQRVQVPYERIENPNR